MWTFLKRNYIPALVALGTVLFIFLLPLTKGGSDSSISEFRSAFGQIAAICFVLYLGIYWVLAKIVRSLSLNPHLIYLAHIFAFILGYYLFFATYSGIAHGGIPMIV